jgi:recombination protein RecA
VPRGRLTEVLGARGSGKTSFLRRLVMETVAHGLGVAFVDATRTLAPRDWAHASDTRGARDTGLWVVRPRRPSQGAWCADLLLRSGAFALVVLDGAPPLTRQVAVRLTRLARDADAALVLVGGDDAPASALAGALRLRVERVQRARRRARHAESEVAPLARARMRWVAITVEKGGQRRTVEVGHVISVASRVCAHPEVPDRRGVARTGAGAREHIVAGAGAALPPSLSLPPDRLVAPSELFAGAESDELEERLISAMG